MCSTCEHPEHVSFIHCPNTVSTLALFVHSLTTMSIHVHLPIIPSTAVLHYSATPCSICTAESDRNSGIHRSFKENVRWYPKKEKILKGKPNISNRLYPTKTTVTAVIMIKIGKSKVPALITQDTENVMSISFANRITRYLDNECIRIGKRIIQHVSIESKHGFLGSNSFRLKENTKNFVVLGNQWKKDINARINPGVKKQGMTP